jgi:hypothetical protein
MAGEGRGMRVVVLALVAGSCIFRQASWILAARTPAAGAHAASDDSEITGVWRGNSTCEVKESACHDEVNVYRISSIAGRPGWVSVAGSKVVEGREIAMARSSGSTTRRGIPCKVLTELSGSRWTVTSWKGL